jgi:hypothetical protein
MKWAKKNQTITTVEIILENGKLLIVDLADFEIVSQAMEMAVEAERFGQRKRWFEPQPNQTEYSQGFFAGRMFEQNRIMEMIKEGNNEG